MPLSLSTASQSTVLSLPVFNQPDCFSPPDTHVCHIQANTSTFFSPHARRPHVPHATTALRLLSSPLDLTSPEYRLRRPEEYHVAIIPP
jgi:hypothetical protein